MITNAAALLNIADTAHPDDYPIIYENALLLKERMITVDWDSVPRGDSEMLHFLHSPLNVVLAYTDLMIEQPDVALNLEQLRRVRHINAAAVEIAEFIRETLE